MFSIPASSSSLSTATSAIALRRRSYQFYSFSSSYLQKQNNFSSSSFISRRRKNQEKYNYNQLLLLGEGEEAEVTVNDSSILEKNINKSSRNRNSDAIEIFQNSLFPTSNSSESSSSNSSLAQILHSRRDSTIRTEGQNTTTFTDDTNIFHPLISSISSNVALQFTHLVLPQQQQQQQEKQQTSYHKQKEVSSCSLLSDELQIFLLADDVKKKGNNTSDDENSTTTTSSATSMLLLDLEMPSVVAMTSESLRIVAKQLLDYSSSSSYSSKITNDQSTNQEFADDDTSTVSSESTSRKLEEYYTHLLTTVVRNASTTQNDVSSMMNNPQIITSSIDPSLEHHFIPSHLYPALLAFSEPKLCITLIERDVEARLAAIAGHNNSALMMAMMTTSNNSNNSTPTASSTQSKKTNINENDGEEDDKMLMMKILSSPSYENHHHHHHHHSSSMLPTHHPLFSNHHSGEAFAIASNSTTNDNSKAPIEPVVFLKLFGSLLRNSGFATEDTFESAHRALILLTSVYSAQLPMSESFSSSSVRNVVTLLLIRLSRLYGRTSRSLEFGELHRSLSENVPWMVHMAPMLYWTWLLGSTLDSARTAAILVPSLVKDQQQQQQNSSSTTTLQHLISLQSSQKRLLSSSSSSTIASSLVFTRLILPLNISAFEAIAFKNLDIETLARLWASFVPHLQEAVTIATSRLLDESSRKIRGTCIKVALFLDENDSAVAGRCDIARKMGFPFTFQRLLQVNNTWGYHTVFFTSPLHNNPTATSENTTSSSNNNNNNLNGIWTIDAKDATSQVIRLFGVALRRGCVPLMIAHPAEFERPLLDFIEQVNGDRPFALMDATANVLSLLAEVYSFPPPPPPPSPVLLSNQDEMSSSSPSSNHSSSSSYPSIHQQREGITKVATRIYDWLRAVLRNSGRGGWDPHTISPIAMSLETLNVIPKSTFWWQCGCGARNPSATVRCTTCLKRANNGSCHWTCANQNCKARQYLDNNNNSMSSSSSSNDYDSSSSFVRMIKKKCLSCNSKHPWLATLEEKFNESVDRSNSNDKYNLIAEDNNATHDQESQNHQRGMVLACSSCLEVQRLQKPNHNNNENQEEDYENDDHEVSALLIESGGTPIIDLCRIGRCVTKLKNNTSNKKLSAAVSGSSAPTSTNFVKNTMLQQQQASTSSSTPPSTSPSTTAVVAANQQKTQQLWTCHECSTENNTTPACSTCGLAEDGNVTVWCCDDCGSWNFGAFPRCRRGCAAKKRSSQKPLPYTRWKCGCGATNPMWRLHCGRCCPKKPVSSSTTTSEGNTYTCPTCHKKPLKLPFRRVREHHYRPGFTIASCGECGADHPRDLAVVRSVNFERPCVSCGDWHTLPGLVVSKKRDASVMLDIEEDEERNITSSTSNKKRKTMMRNTNTNNSTTTSRTTCCSHCGCETDAGAEPFSKWICETCTYEKQKEGSSLSSSPTSESEQQQCWRTGYRCNECGDLHPSLSFSVIRNGTAARFNNGDPHDAVFLWKCQGTDIDDADSCCGHYNPSWDTKCSKCGQIRLVPPPLMTRTSPCSGGVKQQQDSTTEKKNPSSSKNSSPPTSILLKQEQKQEIRARYIPWSCDYCNTVQSPEEVLFCTNCSNPRTPPPCNVCGGNHISLYCPSTLNNSSTSSSAGVSQQYGGIFQQQFY